MAAHTQASGWPSAGARGEHKDQVLNVRHKVLRHQGWSARIADRLGGWMTHWPFLLALVAFHAGWLLWNSGLLPLPRFDPPPFTLLALIASVEAPFISVLILMHQRQEQRVAELREEADLQVALHAEREVTRLVQMVAQVHEAMGLPADLRDEKLEVMEEPLEPERLVEHLERTVLDQDEDEGDERSADEGDAPAESR